MNHCLLTGNLGNDPESFYSREGRQVTAFNLAFSSGQDKTGWIRVVCFNKLATVASEYLHKGARIAVVGNLDQQRWQTEEGQPRSSFQLLAQNIEFIKTNGQGRENNPNTLTDQEIHD